MIKLNNAAKINIFLIIIFIMLIIILYINNKDFTDNTPIVVETITETLLPDEPSNIPDIFTGDIVIKSRAHTNSFYLKTEDVWNKKFLKGVNIGLTLPTTSLNNPNIPYDVYMSWFEDIAAMNSNTIKVFSIMNPDFYNALYDFNIKNLDRPLYLLQGIWVNEDYINIGDAYAEDEKILVNFKKTAKEIVDIVNGNARIPAYDNVSEAIYEKDITQYIVGWILGLEWDPNFILKTNEYNPDKKDFKGKYLYTKNAAPFEAFLCEVGDFLINYQSEVYRKQQPLAFLNWSTTDVLKHTNEPFEEEDIAVLNTENIVSTSDYYPGLFAAIDIYPYYPEFINHQHEYINFLDNGKPNPYRAYLKDLHKQYTVPVIVAEFGIPTSRAKAHESFMGFDQGGIQEKEQGQMILKMMQDINKERYAGAMIFCWQDEWFKQTWNTYKFTTKMDSQRYSNVQSAEQFYGILAYDPGVDKSICYPDGDLSEWDNQSPVFTNNDMKIFVKTDERYLYIAGRYNKPFDFNNEKIQLSLGTTGNGNTTDINSNITFQYPTDFIITLNGKTNSNIYVDAAYDYFNYEYSIKRKIFVNSNSSKDNNSGLFNPIRMFLSNEMYLPDDNKTIPAKSYETGILKFGNANPLSAGYDSLSDYYANNEVFEIRIPWSIINVIDPANKMIMNNFIKDNEIKLVKAGSFYIGGAIINENNKKIMMKKFNIPGYKSATFHKRLKQSYYVLKDGMEHIN